MLLWIGYKKFLAEFRCSISSTHTAWAARRYTALVDKGQVHMNTFEKRLRRSFRTFWAGKRLMSPLDVFMTVAGRDVVADLPLYLINRVEVFGQVYSASTSSPVWDL